MYKGACHPCTMHVVVAGYRRKASHRRLQALGSETWRGELLPKSGLGRFEQSRQARQVSRGAGEKVLRDDGGGTGGAQRVREGRQLPRTWFGVTKLVKRGAGEGLGAIVICACESATATSTNHAARPGASLLTNRYCGSRAPSLAHSAGAVPRQSVQPRRAQK